MQNAAYKNGKEFVTDVINAYGLVEGYRVLEKYLEIRCIDLEEAKFREEMKIAMNEVDQI